MEIFLKGKREKLSDDEIQKLIDEIYNIYDDPTAIAG